MPEQQRLHRLPRICIAAVLTQNIKWILLSIDLEEFHNLRRDSLVDSVVRQRIVALDQLQVQNSTVGVYHLVVAKHIGIDNRTPNICSVYCISIICSLAVLAALNSDPYVAVSTVACRLQYQSMGSD